MLPSPRSILLATVLVAVSVAAAAPAASSASSQGYRVTVSGSQTVGWKVDGVTQECEKRRGSGSGEVSFRYRSGSSTLAFANAYGRTRNFGFTTTVKATGRQTGAFSDTLASPCEGFGPGPTLTASTSSCGASAFWLRISGEVHGAFLYVTGVEAIEKPSSPSRNAYANCPFANVTGGDMANVLAPTGPSSGGCEDAGSVPLYRRTNELATQGRGLANIRLAASLNALLRPRRRTTTLARRVQKTCGLPTTYGPVSVQVRSQLTVTLRRSR